MNRKAAFIGTGNMGGALVEAACRAIGPDQVVISDLQAGKAQEMAERLGCASTGEGAAAAARASYIFLCVKPQALAQTVKELAPALAGRTVVSIAAGVTTASIQSWVGEGIPVLRVMPNTCASIGHGMLALTAAPDVEERHFAAVEEILSEAGRVERIPEALMDQSTAVAGCGPAYVYQLIEAMADAGVLTGLPRRAAQIYAAQTVLGAAAMVLESGGHPAALRDAVCSPGGSTIAGVAALEKRGFRAAVIEAVTAAFEKNQALGK